MESFGRILFQLDLAFVAGIVIAIPVVLIATAFRKPQQH